MSDLRHFEEAAAEYCAWAAASPSGPASEAATARRLLAELYHLALRLPNAGVRTDAGEDVPDAEWKEVYRRFAALPFNYYSSVDPLTVPAVETMTGDLADDLADIWRDLVVGLHLFTGGRALEAYSAWRWRFDAHWGQHAADGIQALHAWCAQGEQ
jgi:hypothetical protein